MKLKFLRYKNIWQVAVCLVLSASLVLGLAVPDLGMNHAQLGNPLGGGDIRDITILKVGEDAEDSESMVVEDEEGVKPTEPEENDGEEKPSDPTEPQQTEPQETKPQETATDIPEPDQGDEDEGNDDGQQGADGGEALELDLAVVMTWYKYGNQPQTIACSPSGTVAQTINTAQLVGSSLRYEFDLMGTDSRFVEITSVSLAEGDGSMMEVPQNGAVEIRLPEGGGNRNYTFRVHACIEKPGADGEAIAQELTFTYILKCRNALDLDMELIWYPQDGDEETVTCGPDQTEGFSVRNFDLTERVFRYALRLTGSLAENARIESASFTTASGQKAGELSAEGGTLILDPAPGADQETYLLSFTVRTESRDVLYQFRLHYQEMLDVQLSFRWMEKGTTQRTKLCQPGDSVSIRLKNNQLSAGAVPYEMELEGADGMEGRILSISYTSLAGDSANLGISGSLPITMAPGASFNTYRISVSAMVKGQRVNFEIIIDCSADVSLQMEYIVRENGIPVTRQILCENTRSKTADTVYDDQLSDGNLRYTMTLTGADTGNVSITSVTCYKSGSGRTVTLGTDGQLELLLKNGKTGENTFEIKAQDAGGSTYSFTINIPYKHRGSNNIRITTNLTDGQQIINESKTNLNVKAWSEDAGGNIISYIPANGTDTKLMVQLDGETLHYVSSSGAASEYDLYPKNPEVGDTNTHTLYIYAEDALGNFGELTLTLKGQRREAGQKNGTATIYVDLSVLGLGVVANLNYDVLADEPVSYVIAKAIMGMDTGDPFGAAKETLGWNGRFAGKLDNGFYLQSLTTGYNAKALEGGKWPGSTEAEVLRSIDERFGAGTGLATLWRCLYRNGLNKSSGSGNSFGEFDYTSGSGWMYSIGGTTYYPGQSMSSVYLQDGDVLTLRYTLAYGWDVGGGSSGYGSTVGYCVSAVNGTFRINHRMETTVNPDGSTVHACRCCGIAEDCIHENLTVVDLEDGTHIRRCNDCKKDVGDPEEHVWIYQADSQAEKHICAECTAAELHSWKELEGSNTATCTDAGVRSVQCTVCRQILEEETGPRGHNLDNQWQFTPAGHYEKCSTCGEEVNHGSHQYKYISGNGWEDFECEICHALHSDDGDHCAGALWEKSATCKNVVYHCDQCGYDMTREGDFDDHHSYAGGVCQFCGQDDPEGAEPTTPQPTDPVPTEPKPAEPDPETPDAEE